MSSRLTQFLCYCLVVMFMTACGGSNDTSDSGLSKDFWRRSVNQPVTDDGASVYSVSGSVSGLDGQRLSIRLNGEETLVVDGDDPQFFFNQTLVDGVQYKVDIIENDTGLTCSVNQGSGIITGGNISNITISCDNRPQAWNIEGFGNITVDYPLPVVNWTFRVIDKYTGKGVEHVKLQDLNIQEDDKDLSSKESFVELEKLETSENFQFSFHTVIMLDVSSSLTEDDVSAMKAAVKDLLRDPETGASRLSDNQVVSLSIFDSRVRDLASASHDLDTLLAAVDAITLGTSSTNLYGAIFEGVKKWNNVSDLNTVETGALIVIQMDKIPQV